jgi:hypothetical protein
MSKTKLKILTPTGVIIKDLEIELGEYTSDFRILVEHEEYRVLYAKEVTTENQNKEEIHTLLKEHCNDKGLNPNKVVENLIIKYIKDEKRNDYNNKKLS